MQNIITLHKKLVITPIASMLLILLILLCANTTAQVPNPRIPAEWEEVQAVVMEVGMESLAAFVPWELVIDPYVKTAQACIDENIDFYLIERESHSYRYPETLYLDTVFQNRGIVSPKIHFIEYPDSLRINYGDFWARDNGMYCVYENGIGNMRMYHFENDYPSEFMDSYFGLESNKIEQEGGLEYKYFDGGNFLTDGHGTFNIMCDYSTGITYDYLHFNRFFGIDKSVKFNLGGGHIDLHAKMLNEETIIVNSGDTLISLFQNSKLLSAFGREFKIIPLNKPPVYYDADGSLLNKGHCGYTNALIMNNTILEFLQKSKQLVKLV